MTVYLFINFDNLEREREKERKKERQSREDVNREGRDIVANAITKNNNRERSNEGRNR